MDDVEITDVDDGGVEVDKAPPQNQDLSSVTVLGELLSQYGWYLLVLSVLLYALIQYLSRRRSRQSPPPHLEQDATLVARRQEAMEAARRKMQDELDAKAAIFREKQKQQEEEKRRQKIEMWESMQKGKSYKGAAKLSQTTDDQAGPSTKVQKPSTAKKPLRNADYNPLTGQGGGTCTWRPGRRGPSSGG
ncbi:selenoprotein S isoform X2 [Echeneis naucrates]|uniref:selenoprotein S isoform X2 n=1 Tax=Echeneis naucrates TaxID=173247 RepID=UPI001113AA5E|nr:selenoprotein S isoform X2 [Echeneis naucrates]